MLKHASRGMRHSAAAGEGPDIIEIINQFLSLILEFIRISGRPGLPRVGSP